MANEIAWLFLKEIIQLHGVPDSIVSDRDPKFMSIFWRELQHLMGVKLLMSTAFHPQMDGTMVLWCEPKITITEGALRRISELPRYYFTQRGSMRMRMGLGFNLCVAPTLTFCPVFRMDGWTDVRMEGGTRLGDLRGY